MITERTSFKNSPNGDPEPWIVNDANSIILAPSPGTLGSAPSRYSFASSDPSNGTRKCVLILFAIAVFVVGVLLAFLIGHWAARDRQADSPDSIMKTTQSPVVDTAISSSTSLTSNTTNNFADFKNITIFDIYPLTIVDVAPKVFHFASNGHLADENYGRSQLVALPKTIRPKHYDLQDEAELALNESAIVSFTTKFEPSLARTFFPCWDEPRWKATFNISISHLSSVIVLTNTALYRRKQKQQRHSVIQTQFRETPPMSTFLLAFAYGPFIRIEKRTAQNVPLSIWAFPDDLVHTKFASNVSPNIFDKLTDEFAIPYSLSKIDFIVARSFPVGGMENWGLIVFQNEMFLLDSMLEGNANMSVDLLAVRYDIQKLVTHELAHQWFGNLVTINNWSELWISEGFASFYSTEFLSREHPTLGLNEYYSHLSQLISKQTAGEKFALVKELRSESEIEKAFNPHHLYTKGSVIVKMIRDLVDAYNFREGVRRFLKTNAYKSVGRDALWKAMPAYTDHGVESARLEKVIEPWLLNDGMPEVIVSRSYSDGGMRLIQRTSDQNRYIVFLRTPTMRRIENANSGKTHGRIRNLHRKSPMNRMKWSNLSLEFASTNDQAIKITKESTAKLRNHRLINKKRHTKREKQLWSIPFSYLFGAHLNEGGEHLRKFWLHNETTAFIDNELRATVPLLANPNWIYPYRVNYDIENWKLLARMLHENHLMIPLKSRMQLLFDAEFYLKQSNVPEIYLEILSYLTKESDMGMLLFGLDALYRFIDMFRGGSISDSLLSFARQICEWIEKVMDETKMNTEMAALWLIDPNRLIHLYKLRCAVNLSSCDFDNKVTNWIASGGLTEDDHYSQMTAICNYLFTKASKSEFDLIENGLKQSGDKWSVFIQLSTCVRDEQLLKKAVKHIISTKNAAIYTAVLQNKFTLHYNAKFRELFWRQIAAMPLLERKLLFSVESEQSTQVAQILLHSVQTDAELKQLMGILPEWNSFVRLHLEYLRRKFLWINRIAKPRIEHFLRKFLQ